MPWVERDTGVTLDNDLQGGWDPWWFTPEKQGTNDPNYAIFFRCQTGAIYRSVNCGQSWINVTPLSDPPNYWGDTPAPLATTVDYIQRVDNIHINGWHLFLVRWQSGANWRSWLLLTEDDGVTWTWKAMDTIERDDDGYYYPVNLDEGAKHISTTPPYQVTGDNEQNCVGYNEDEGGSKLDIVLGGGGNDWQQCVADFGQPFTLNVGTVDVDGANIRGKSGQFSFYNEMGFNPWTNPKMQISTNKVAWTDVLTWASYPTNDESDTEQISAVNFVNGRYIRMLGSGGFKHPDAGDAYLKLMWKWIKVLPTAPLGGGASVYVIWADVDTEDGSSIWLTTWIDGDLHLSRRDTANLALTGLWNLGAATIGEVTAKTYIAYPMTPLGNKNHCIVHGRFANVPTVGAITASIIETRNGGLSFSIREIWGANICSALQVGAMREDGSRPYYAIKDADAGNPAKFYYGLNGLAYISDLPFGNNVGVVVDALTISGNGNVAVGADTAGAIMVVQSTDIGATWTDITDNYPVIGTVSSLTYFA